MENIRIEKLLFSEYKELAREKILVESAFAETSRDGRGIREVALGLTRTKLLVATDVFKAEEFFWCLPGIDPSIETLQLISVFCDGRAKYYELGGLGNRTKCWRRWQDQIRRLLERRSLGSSLSETTVAGSSTCISSTYCLQMSSEFPYDSGASGRCVRRKNRLSGGGDDRTLPNPTWTQRNLYLGPGYQELIDGTYVPHPLRYTEASLKEIQDELTDCSPNKKNKNHLAHKSDARYPRIDQQQSDDICDVIYDRKQDCETVDERLLATDTRIKVDRKYHDEDDLQDMFELKPTRNEIMYRKGQYPSIVLDIEEPDSDSFKNYPSYNYRSLRTSRTTKKNKFAGPKSQAEARTGKFARKLSRFGFGVEEKCKSGLWLEPYKKMNLSANRPIDFHKLVERGVTIWENACKGKEQRRKKQLRRYGLSTATYFLHALGPWSVQPGDRESCQCRLRSKSCVTIRRQSADPELRLPVSRRQLTAGISLTDLTDMDDCAGLTGSTRGRVVLFWTPDYWYRPRAASDAYKEIRGHLTRLDQFRAERENDQLKLRKRIAQVFSKRSVKRWSRNNVKPSVPECQSTDSGSGCMLNKVFSTSQRKEQVQDSVACNGTSHLRRLLRLDFRVTLWDLDSTTFFRQLTLIDRELFLRIPWRHELAIVAKQRSTRDAPNLGAWIAFAHRISCLTASEVLSSRKLDMRARLVARLINAAESCFLVGNFHSARSIVAGLQSPAIYRLQGTWTHLRTRHAMRYETMEKLCRIFRSTRTRRYRRAWSKAEANPPFLPFVGDVLAQLLAAFKSEMAVRKNATKKTAPKGHEHQERRIRFHSPVTEPKDEEIIWTNRERDLARQYSVQWRTRVKSRCYKSSLIDELANWLERCQRQVKLGYDYPGHSLAWEFLLKARYREDRDNFFASFELESSSLSRCQ